MIMRRILWTIAILFLILLAFGWWDRGSGEEYRFVRTIGEKGSGHGQFDEPFDIAIDRDGFLYVTDARNHRVQKFDRERRFILEWGKQGEGDGLFEKPIGIAIDNDGYVYVSDYDNDYIQKFSPDGRFILRWGKSGKGEGEFDSPSGIALGSKNNIYVMDLYNHRVQKFDRNGNFIATWDRKNKVNNIKSVLSFLFPEEKPGDFYYPGKIAISPDDTRYMCLILTTTGLRFLQQMAGISFNGAGWGSGGVGSGCLPALPLTGKTMYMSLTSTMTVCRSLQRTAGF